MHRAPSLACYSGAIALLISLLWIPLSAATPQGESLPNPTFRATTHLVLLDVIVTDKGGKGVSGLRAEDFLVKENGKEQKIAFFTPPSEAVAPPPPALPPGVYSNAPAYRIQGGAPTVIVLDAVNTQYQDQKFAQRQILKFLKDQFKAGQRMAVFVLADKLSLLQDFTDSPDVLLASVEELAPMETELNRATSAPAPILSSVPARADPRSSVLAAALGRFDRSELQYQIDRRIEITLAAMGSLTRVLGGLPGRKNIVWLTAGFPFSLIPEDENARHSQMGMGSLYRSRNPSTRTIETSQYDERIRDVATQMATSQIAIYPVDVRGLAVSMRMDPFSNQQTMREIAFETGGRVFVNRNDVDNGVALALRDQSATYTVGYYPQNKTLDRKYRSIALKVDRPGLETTYRRGYFAIDAAKRHDGKADQDLAEAWQDQAPDTLVSFQAGATAADHGKTRVEFLVDASSLSARDDGAGWRFKVGFYIAAFSPEGKMLSSRAMRLDREFTPAMYQEIMQQGMRIHFDVDAPTGSNELRLAVRDDLTGYFGTLRVPGTSPK